MLPSSPASDCAAPPRPRSLLLIDDSRRLQESLAFALRHAGWRVDVAGDGPAGLSLARERAFDLVLLDLMLPGLPGEDVLRALRSLGNQVRVLVLTARDRVEDCVTCLDLGADDYLVKPFALEELLARTEALMLRPASVCRREIIAGSLRIDRVERRAFWDGRALDLTPRGLLLLACLAADAGRVLSPAEISACLYQDKGVPPSNVLAVNIRELRVCLVRCGVPPLIRTVRGRGYVLRVQGP